MNIPERNGYHQPLLYPPNLNGISKPEWEEACHEAAVLIMGFVSI
jgi:hypothetical protein